MSNLQTRFNSRVNSYERNNADAPIAVNPAATQLASVRGNPSFAAQFDIEFKLKYFSVVDSTGVYTLISAAAVVAAVPALGTQLAGFLYGNSDYASGFAKLQNAFPLSGGWIYGEPGIYGKDMFRINGSFIDANVTPQLRKGDLVIPAYFDNGTTTYVALMIVRCNQVGYGTLLDSLNSDRFIMNMVRYVMSDITAVGLAQYDNNIFIMKQSLFGKFDSDNVSPTSFKMPEQFQPGIIDVPIKKGIDKQVALGSYFNYDVVNTKWSLFVEYVEKLSF